MTDLHADLAALRDECDAALAGEVQANWNTEFDRGYRAAFRFLMHRMDNLLAAHTPPSETATEECEDGVFGSQDIADALGGRGPLSAPPSSSDADRDVGLSLAETTALNLADDQHDYPTETDDGLVMRCRCGATPPAHYLGQQVDEALWLWEHRRRERHAVVERIVTARVDEAIGATLIVSAARAQPEGTEREVVYGVVLDDFGSVDQYDTREEAEAYLASLGGLGIVRITQERVGEWTEVDGDE